MRSAALRLAVVGTWLVLFAKSDLPGRGPIQMDLFRGVPNCTDCGKRPPGMNYPQLYRLQVIKKQILDSLFNGEKNSNVLNEPKVRDALEGRIHQQNTVVKEKYQPIYPPTEIISFSEAVADNVTDDDVLQFSVDSGDDPGAVQAVSAHLWILVRRRKATRKRGKKILLQVSDIDSRQSRSHRNNKLTFLRTRVKKTRWQRISLPASIVQNALDSPTPLHLKVMCKGCGRLVRPVLLYEKDGDQLRRKKKRRHRSGRAGHKHNRHRENTRVRTKKKLRPFLVINTRTKVPSPQ